MDYIRIFFIRLKDIMLMLIFFVVAIIISAFLNYFTKNDTTVLMIFLLAVFFTARFTSGYLCGIIASVLSIFLINYFFTFPYFEFNMTLPGYPVTILTMLIVSIVTSMVTSRLLEQDKLKKEAEHELMRSNLLRSVSHDLRTPLTSIIGATDALKSNDINLSRDERIELYDDINEEAQWLYSMVENLLSVTRLSENGDKIHKNVELVEEIIPSAVEKIKKYYNNIDISISIPDELLFVPMDSTLIKQVLINLMENSIRHGKASKISLNVSTDLKSVKFAIADNGTGIEKSVISNINSGKYISPKSYSDSSKYMGIGLSVCDTIIKAHGGFMHAENLPDGASVSFNIPLDEENENEEIK